MISCFLSIEVGRILVQDMELQDQARDRYQDSESWILMRLNTKTQFSRKSLPNILLVLISVLKLTAFNITVLFYTSLFIHFLFAELTMFNQSINQSISFAQNVQRYTYKAIQL